MTRIDFYFNVDNKAHQLAALAALVLPQQRRLYVLAADRQSTEQLETALWSAPATGFLPHCRRGHRLAAETPIVLDWEGAAPPHDDILVNLQAAHPPFFSRFQQLMELVGREEADRAAARARFRFYRDRGYQILTHDVSGGQI